MTDCRHYTTEQVCEDCRRSHPDKYAKKGFDLAGFQIRVPAADGDLYHLSLDDKSVTAKTLKLGIVKLFHELGVIPGGEVVEYDFVNILKDYPDSYNKKLILDILEAVH
jgi:hypothetical protein